MTKAMRIIILDDHRLFADSFSLFLEKYKLATHTHCFDDAEEFTDFLLKLGRQPVYIFLDYYLHKQNGLSLVPEIRRLNKEARIIFLTSAVSPTVIQNLVLAKPHAILSKFCDFSTVFKCIQKVEANDFFIDDDIQKILQTAQKKAPNFTPRELELLRYFANGLSIAETAQKMNLSPHTIISHRRKMMAKANCHSIGQLVKYAQDYELI